RPLRDVERRVEEDPLARHGARPRERLDRIREVVEDAEVQDHVERAPERLRAHGPEVEHAEIDVLESDDRADQLRLLDELGTRAAAPHPARPAKRAPDRPETRAAGYVEHA